MKSLFILFCLFNTMDGNSQTLCDCDTVFGNTNFTNYCYEYFDANWNWVEKEKGKFKYVNWYYKGTRSNRYPLSALSKTKLLFQNHKKVIVSDSVVLLNGLYQFRMKDSIVLEAYLYKNGYLIKHINQDKFILNKKHKGQSLSELSEYDYRTVPFREHYMLFRGNNAVKKNYIISQENGRWLHYPATDTMSANPTEFTGVTQ